MNYADVTVRLGIDGWCPGGCGITSRSHQTGFVFLDVVHWQERHVNRRGLYRFLKLVAQRERLNEPAFLNDDGLYGWLYPFLDSTSAVRRAAALGIRLPAALSKRDRARTRMLARKAGVKLSTYQRAYRWANYDV